LRERLPKFKSTLTFGHALLRYYVEQRDFSNRESPTANEVAAGEIVTWASILGGEWKIIPMKVTITNPSPLSDRPSLRRVLILLRILKPKELLRLKATAPHRCLIEEQWKMVLKTVL
jgi:hypothetical protein